MCAWLYAALQPGSACVLMQSMRATSSPSAMERSLAPTLAYEDELRADAPREPQAANTRLTPVLRTMAEAMEHVQNLFDERIDAALHASKRADDVDALDRAARRLFYTLMDNTRQRAVFRGVAAQPRAWPRLRALFGAPPYGFLLPSDDTLLRAAGICPARVHLAHDEQRVAASVAQFGSGHATDDSGRKYRAIPAGNRAAFDDNDPLPPHAIFEHHHNQNDTIVVEVMRKVVSRKRAASMRDEVERASFPVVGKPIALHESATLARMQGRAVPLTAWLVPLRVVLRAHHARTAVMLARVQTVY